MAEPVGFGWVPGGGEPIAKVNAGIAKPIKSNEPINI